MECDVRFHNLQVDLCHLEVFLCDGHRFSFLDRLVAYPWNHLPLQL